MKLREPHTGLPHLLQLCTDTQTQEKADITKKIFQKKWSGHS